MMHNKNKNKCEKVEVALDHGSNLKVANCRSLGSYGGQALPLVRSVRARNSFFIAKMFKEFFAFMAGCLCFACILL
jgi:hypothetical protein